MPSVVAFDIDGTLATSKQPITPEMAQALERLMKKVPVAIMTGGNIELCMEQIANPLSQDAPLEQLYFFPTSGASCYFYKDGAWTIAYEHLITQEEFLHIKNAIEQALEETQFVAHEPAYGERIEYRKSGVTFSALGQKAPVELKYAWDPDRIKLSKLQNLIAPHVPGFKVQIGGKTSIDVTREGIDKAYAIRWCAAHWNITEDKIMYVGDALFPGGNDSPVLETKAQARPVKDPTETYALIQSLIAQ